MSTRKGRPGPTEGELYGALAQHTLRAVERRLPNAETISAQVVSWDGQHNVAIVICDNDTGYENIGNLGASPVHAVSHIGMVQEPQIDLGHIANEHKIPLLRTVLVTVGTLEQLDLALGPVLVEIVESYRSHASLVGFPGAVNIEVTETRHLR